jgi:DNA-binding transcriptional regulator YiaG
MEAHEITRRREQLGLMQRQLAAAIGVDRVTLWRWETGANRPRGLAARQLAATLARLEKEQAQRAARRAAYAARRASSPTDHTR